MKSFAQLFAGRTDCYGSYQITGTRENGKKDGEGTTYSRPGTQVTTAMYQAHLAGEKMLGIVPILPDSTCSWFALDIDKYDIDHSELNRRIQQLEIPAVHCRSKSGGVHLYCFVDGFIEASVAMDLMRSWNAKLGPFTKYDMYPKQPTVDERSMGNWIILPYFDATKADRFAYGMNGERLSLEEFEQLANAMLIRPDELKKLLGAKQERVTKDEMRKGAPPCIDYFYQYGLEEGGRNNALAHMAVFFKKVAPDIWEDLMFEFNAEQVDPPLTRQEVENVIKNANKKDYAYFCNQTPMSQHCNKEQCKMKRYGVGPDKTKYGEYEISTLTKIDSDPPIYLIEINSRTVKMSSDELINPKNFRRRVMESCNILIPAMKGPQHEEVIAPLINEAMIIEAAPEEASLDGQVVSVFREWTKNMIWRCKRPEDILKGLPYYHEADNIIIFRGEDLMKAFRTHYRRDIPMKDLWTVLRSLMCDAKVVRAGTETVRAWQYPLGEEPWFRRPNDDKF